MFDPKDVNRFAAWAVSAFLGCAVSSVTVFPNLSKVAADAVKYVLTVQINVFGFLLISSLLSFAVFYWVNYLLYRKQEVIMEMKAKIENHETAIEHERAKYRESEVLRRLDFVTGIPSQIQFGDDLEALRRNPDPLQNHFLIFMDLVDFRKLNEKYGYTTADSVIKLFARSLNDSMRRNESIYKYPIGDLQTPDELRKRAYRKYTGGDEFLIVLSGSHADAIGFLNRVERDLKRSINPIVQFSIINSTDWAISFRASVVKIFKNDSEQDVIDRAHHALRSAILPDATMRVVWSDADEITKGEAGKWPLSAYAEARELFAVRRAADMK